MQVIKPNSKPALKLEYWTMDEPIRNNNFGVVEDIIEQNFRRKYNES